jgi:hypothetical protein
MRYETLPFSISSYVAITPPDPDRHLPTTSLPIEVGGMPSGNKNATKKEIIVEAEDFVAPLRSPNSGNRPG